MSKWLLAGAATLLSTSVASAAIPSADAARLTAAAAVVRDMKAVIPADYWNRADCVAVIPDLKKAAFIVGGEYGKGVMSCRAGDRWSAPLFMQMAKGSWGFQAGAQQVDLVLLVMNESGVQKLLDNKVTLGADVSVAAGPVGRQAAAATDVLLKAEILSYSRAQGLFAGIDLSGGVLRPDEDVNVGVYGRGASPRTILAAREISAPTEASAFLDALSSNPGPTATRGEPATERSAQADGTAVPATPRDAELRARIAALQQSVDRLLAGSSSTPVGTGGNTASADAATIVSVDRERLVQIRQQLDELMRMASTPK